MRADVLDLRQLVQWTSDNDQLLLHLVQQFLSEVNTYLSEIEDALVAGDMELVSERVHKFSGVLANFGAVSAVEVAKSMEVQARRGSVEQDPALLRERVADVIDALNEWLDENSSNGANTR